MKKINKYIWLEPPNGKVEIVRQKCFFFISLVLAYWTLAFKSFKQRGLLNSPFLRSKRKIEAPSNMHSTIYAGKGLKSHTKEHILVSHRHRYFIYFYVLFITPLKTFLHASSSSGIIIVLARCRGLHKLEKQVHSSLLQKFQVSCTILEEWTVFSLVNWLDNGGFECYLKALFSHYKGNLHLWLQCKCRRRAIFSLSGTSV